MLLLARRACAGPGSGCGSDRRCQASADARRPISRYCARQPPNRRAVAVHHTDRCTTL